MIKKSIYFDSLLLSIILLFAFIWSSLIFRQWSTDFGNYYLMAQLSESNGLYDEIFTHKGPVFFNLIALLSIFLKWGVFQSFITYSLFNFMYLSSFYLLIKLYSDEILVRLLCVFLICSTLFLQNTNSIISYVMMSFVLVALIHFELFKRNQKTFNLLIAYISLSFAFLTRVDALIFSTFIFYFIIYNSTQRLIFLKSILIFSLIFSLIFVFFMHLNNFSLFQYFNHNILFNLAYSSMGGSDGIVSFYKPIAVYFTIVCPLVFIVSYKKNILDLSIHYVKFDFIFLVALPLIFWLFTSSAKLSHLLILLVPTIIFFIKNFNFQEINKKILLLLLSYYFILSLLTAIPGAKSLVHFYKSDHLEMYSEEDKKIVEFLSTSSYQNLYLIGSRAWFYIFTDMKVQASSNNWWFYLKPGFQTAGTLKSHSRYNESPNKTIIAIDKRIFQSELNEYFDEIIVNSSLHDFETKNFQFRVIKNNK